MYISQPPHAPGSMRIPIVQMSNLRQREGSKDLEGSRLKPRLVWHPDPPLNRRVSILTGVGEERWWWEAFLLNCRFLGPPRDPNSASLGWQKDQWLLCKSVRSQGLDKCWPTQATFSFEHLPGPHSLLLTAPKRGLDSTASAWESDALALQHSGQGFKSPFFTGSFTLVSSARKWEQWIPT